MASNLSIDPELLEAALKIGGYKTKKDTVNQALIEFVQRRKMSDIIDLFGKIEYDTDYDYKAARWSKHMLFNPQSLENCIFRAGVKRSLEFGE